MAFTATGLKPDAKDADRVKVQSQHILLIPKEHVASVADVGDEHAAMLADLLQAAAHLARTEGIDQSGWRLIANVGPDAGQEVFHLHFHLLGGKPLGRMLAV